MLINFCSKLCEGTRKSSKKATPMLWPEDSTAKWNSVLNYLLITFNTRQACSCTLQVLVHSYQFSSSHPALWTMSLFAKMLWDQLYFKNIINPTKKKERKKNQRTCYFFIVVNGQENGNGINNKSTQHMYAYTSACRWYIFRLPDQNYMLLS